MSDLESTRRPAGASTSGTLAIVLAVIAVVAGFFILRSITGDTDDDIAIGSNSSTPAGGSATDGSAPNTTLAPAPTTPPLTFTGASVIVANANGEGGSAGKISTVLKTGTEFTMIEPATNASSNDPITTSQILYDSTNAAALPVAETLATVLPGSLVPTVISGTPPVQDGDLKGAGVVLMLGTDLTTLTVAQLNVPAATTASVPTVGSTSTSSTVATSG